MERAASVEEFLAAPLGKWLAGKSFVMWVLSPTLAGSVYFGRPTEEDFPALLQLSPLPLSPVFASKFDAVIDCARLEGLSAASFELLVRYLGEVSGLGERVRRVAVVRPGNMTGATLGGLFYELVQTRFRAGLFTDRVEAYHWLGRDPERPLVESALEEALGVPSLLRELREWLTAHLQERASRSPQARGSASPRSARLADKPSVTAAARALGRSPRSLQRHLQSCETSFRSEIDRARVRAAEALLVDGDQKLEVIARQVGCASLSHFSTLFRRTTGEAPSDFRQRRR